MNLAGDTLVVFTTWTDGAFALRELAAAGILGADGARRRRGRQTGGPDNDDKARRPMGMRQPVS